MLAACQQPSEECLSIAFTGDVLLDRGVRQQIRKKGVEHLFESVTPLFRSVDATVINLECPYYLRSFTTAQEIYLPR